MKKIVLNLVFIFSVLTLLLMNAHTTVMAESNDLNHSMFGPNVYIFDETMSDSDIQNVITTTYQTMTGEGARGEFSSNRYALLFKPGEYDVDINVGFYTTIAGLGLSPDDVVVNGEFDVNAKWADGNGTRNFWRSVENFSVHSEKNARWAVSQAAPMRRMHFNRTLDLFDLTASNQAGWVSGGYIADSVFDQNVAPGSQQQFFSRNNQYNEWQGSNWNTVLVGDQNPPSNVRPYPQQTYTIINETPIVREKPFLYLNDQGEYHVFVPSLQEERKGVTWIDGETPGKSISINDFFIANPAHTAEEINFALDSGKHLFLTPGIYYVDEPIQVNHPNTIIFGLGYPSITPRNGVTAMKIADVDGVQLSGVLFDAGEISSDSLLEVGPETSELRHIDNPTTLHDVFFRVGGYHLGKADVSVVINSNDVLVDHFWVWRADHGNGVGWNKNTGKNGLVVNGNDVTIYALFVEHYQEYQTIWNGNGGLVYFYQNEIPYDIPSQSSWMSHDGTKNGYAAYKVGDHVTSHELWGAGSYSYFRDAAVKLNNSFEVPNATGINMNHMTTVWLNGVAGSEITHVINNIGSRVYENGAGMVTTVTNFTGGDVTPPTIPTNLSATPLSSSTIQLSWDPSTDNVGVATYDIYRDDKYIGSSTTTNYVDLKLKEETTYSYKIKAKDGGDNGSDFSQSVSAKTKTKEYYLSRLSWKLTTSANSNEDLPRYMIDSNTTTRWSSGSAMTPGMSVIIDLQKEQSFDGLIMDSGNSVNDYAHGYKVFVSSDGTSWGDAVVSGDSELPLIYVNFPTQTARYVKIEQTGSSSSWWSIAELNIYSTTPIDETPTITPGTDSNNNLPIYIGSGVALLLLGVSGYYLFKKRKSLK